MKCQIHKGETPAVLGYCNINHCWWVWLLSPSLLSCSRLTLSVQFKYFTYTSQYVKRKETHAVKSRELYWVPLPLKICYLVKSGFWASFFSQGNWGKHFYVILWCLLCTPRIIYTRIIRVLFPPLGYNNRQRGQKADCYHKFKLTGAHKNYAIAWGTCEGQGLTQTATPSLARY